MATTYTFDHTYPDGLTLPIRLVLNSRLARLVYLVQGFPYITIGGTVYSASSWINETVLRHEARHVRQWHEYGKLGFLRRYWRAHRDGGYHGNWLEEEAREYAGEPLRYGQAPEPPPAPTLPTTRDS